MSIETCENHGREHCPSCWVGMAETEVIDMETRYIVAKTGKCFFCKNEVGEEDYCYGCHSFVCDVCDYEQPGGQHRVIDHLFAPSQGSELW